MDKFIITVADLKNRPAAFVDDRLLNAHRAGQRFLFVLNRGKPILQFGLAADMPTVWQGRATDSMPLADFKRSKVALTTLQKAGRPVVLKPRSGPDLAIWPIDDAAKPTPEQLLVQRLEYLERQVKRLRRLELQVQAAQALLDQHQTVMTVLAVATQQLTRKPRRKAAASPVEGAGGDAGPDE